MGVTGDGEVFDNMTRIIFDSYHTERVGAAKPQTFTQLLE
jgi:hypothetical protein